MKGTLRPGRKAGVLALAVLLLTCVLMAGAVSADDIWDGTAITPVSPSGNTYSISSGSELAWVASEVNSGEAFHGMTLELTKNIDLGNHEWTPIGSADNAFAGIFDGKNYTISNLKITKDLENSVSNNYVGLFGYTVSPSVIKNIKIQNVNVSGSLYVGGVVGMAYTGKEIRNCHISGDIHIKGWWYVGGIGGNGYMGVIADCSVEGEGKLSEIRGIEASPGSAGHIGGIWGLRGEGDQKIINCTVKNIAISGADRTGGISGILHYGNAIEECIVTDVTVSISSGDADTVGGIAGTYVTESGSTQTISGCTFKGEVYKQGVLISEGDRILGGAFDGKPYPRTDVTIRENTFNGISVDDRPAKIDDVYYDTLEDALNEAKSGDTVTLLQDVSLANALTIDKAITLNATDSADKPTLTVPQVLIAVPGVTLDNLKIQQTEGTSPLFYTIQVTAQGDVGQITVTDSEIIPVTEGRGFSNNAGAGFDITFTGNTVKAADEGDKLEYAIYINGYDNKYVFQKNIIGSCSFSQFGFDQYVDALDTPVDISKNYWGGSEPSIELFVGSDPGEPDLTGQDTYYSRLNSDGTIDESSLVSPVEPTPQPTPLPPSYSSGSGNMDNAYRVLFNDGATTLSVQTDLSSGDKLTKPETPVKDGYTFAGWYKDSACTQAWDFETGISGDMTLYAKWTAAGSSGETEATATPTKTQTAVTTPQPTKTQTAAATTSAPEATTAAGVSPTLTQAPAPVAGALFGLLAAGVLLRRRFQ